MRHPLLLLLAATLLNACGGAGDNASSGNGGSVANITLSNGPTPASPRAPGAAPAANVAIGDAQITINSSAGKVSISRDPLQIRFANPAGQVVLEQVAASGSLLEPGVVYDEPVGGNNVPDMALHAPFSYLVGAELSPQFPAGPWVANYLTHAHTGIQYHATEVTAAEAIDNGVRLELATNDPIGRSISVTIISDIAGSFGISASVSPDTGVVFLADSFVLQNEESFHGFGGRHNAVDQRGKSITNFLQAQNVGAGDASIISGSTSGSGDVFLFPSGEDAAYYISTAFVSTKGYGFMQDQTVPSRYYMGSANPDAWQLNAIGSELKYLVVPGNLDTAMETLSEIQGRHRVPHSNDLGPTLSRAIRILSPDADDAESYEAKVFDDLAKIAESDLPIKGYAFEAWEILDRETARAIVDELHARGIRAYLYNRNYVGIDPANTERPESALDPIASGYVATNILGAPYFFGTTFGGLGAVIDFTNPEAKAWWQGRIREMIVDVGADGFMQDFGENVMLDMHFADGSTGYTMHNHYPVLFHQATREAIDQIEAETGRHVFFWTRSGYSGRMGASAYESSNFPGDENSDWSRASGIASLTTDMLSRTATGSYGFNTDIGGYFDYHVPPADAELFTRWAFWAALSPVFRVHNSSSNGVRMPWFYGDETMAHWKQAAELHLAAAPLIMRLWKEAQTSGIPPTRGLWYHYPDDARARAEDQQWMLGPNVLVAPVVEQSAVTRDVYLPAGCWTHVDSGDSYQGPADITVDAPINSLPYFFKCGTKAF